MGIQNSNTKLCADPQKAQLQYGPKNHNKLKVNRKICRRSAHGQQEQFFIQSQIIFTNVLINIVGDLDSL